MNWHERAIKIFSAEHSRSKRHVCSRILLACLVTSATTASWARSDGPQATIRSHRSNAILDWNQALLNVIVATHAPPTVAARALATVHTSAFNAWSAYTADAQSTERESPRRRPEDEWTSANKDLAISYACYRSIIDLFPSQETALAITAQEHHVQPDNFNVQPTTPDGVGNIAAAAVLFERHHDGSNQLGDLHPGFYSDYTSYVPVNTPQYISDPDRWQPLEIPNNSGIATQQVFVTPQWGNVTPFAAASLRLSREGPIRNAIAHDAYVHQADDLIRLSAYLDDEQKIIAEYWALGSGTVTPPGRWFEFAHFVSERDKHTVDDDAQMFFVLGNAMLDSSISCWKAKRKFDSERPITAIHFLYSGTLIEAWAGPGLGTRLIDGSEWKPYQLPSAITPAFPEYLSGHSTFSAAAAEILTLWTGQPAFGESYTAAPGNSQIEPGITPKEPVMLVWPSFRSAADQAGLSRRYGGIHFEKGDLEGRELGRATARQVWNKALEYLSRSTMSDIEQKQP